MRSSQQLDLFTPSTHVCPVLSAEEAVVIIEAGRRGESTGGCSILKAVSSLLARQTRGGKS